MGVRDENVSGYVCSVLKGGRSTGLEPATSGTTIQCSNQLSYDRHKYGLAMHMIAFCLFLINPFFV